MTEVASGAAEGSQDTLHRGRWLFLHLSDVVVDDGVAAAKAIDHQGLGEGKRLHKPLVGEWEPLRYSSLDAKLETQTLRCQESAVPFARSTRVGGSEASSQRSLQRGRGLFLHFNDIAAGGTVAAMARDHCHHSLRCNTLDAEHEVDTLADFQPQMPRAGSAAVDKMAMIYGGMLPGRQYLKGMCRHGRYGHAWADDYIFDPGGQMDLHGEGHHPG